VLSARPHLDRALASGVHGVGVLARELGREPSPGLLSAGKLRQSEHACVQPTATPHRSGALTAQGIGTAHTGGGTAYQRQRWRSCPVGSPAHPAGRCVESAKSRALLCFRAARKRRNEPARGGRARRSGARRAPRGRSPERPPRRLRRQRQRARPSCFCEELGPSGLSSYVSGQSSWYSDLGRLKSS